MTMSFGNYCALFLIPGWREIMQLPPAERMRGAAQLRQPSAHGDDGQQ